MSIRSVNSHLSLYPTDSIDRACKWIILLFITYGKLLIILVRRHIIYLNISLKESLESRAKFILEKLPDGDYLHQLRYEMNVKSISIDRKKKKKNGIRFMQKYSFFSVLFLPTYIVYCTARNHTLRQKHNNRIPKTYSKLLCDNHQINLIYDLVRWV